MSHQQPCLPIGNDNNNNKTTTKKRSRGSRRWKQQQHGGGRQQKRQKVVNNEEDDDNNKNDNSIRNEHNNTDNEIIVFDDIESMDATEYLKRVSKQAKKLPDIFVSTTNYNNNVEMKHSTNSSSNNKTFIPIDGSAASLNYLISSRASLTEVPSINHLPKNCDMWIQSTLESFNNLRSYLVNCWLNGVGGKSTMRQKLPPMKDQIGWYIFCFGKHYNKNNKNNDLDRNSYYGDDDDDDHSNGKEEEEDNSDSVVDEWESNIPPNGYKPTTKLILQMDQVLVRRVLTHLASYYIDCESSSVLQQQQHCFAWFYALLARLEKPIHRDDAAMLFSILKKLTTQRSKIKIIANDGDENDNNNTIKEEEQEELAKLNCLIVIIGIYFEQGGTAVMKL